MPQEAIGFCREDMSSSRGFFNLILIECRSPLSSTASSFTLTYLWGWYFSFFWHHWCHCKVILDFCIWQTGLSILVVPQPFTLYGYVSKFSQFSWVVQSVGVSSTNFGLGWKWTWQLHAPLYCTSFIIKFTLDCVMEINVIFSKS